jgi:hypothetical protein
LGECGANREGKAKSSRKPTEKRQHEISLPRSASAERELISVCRENLPTVGAKTKDLVIRKPGPYGLRRARSLKTTKTNAWPDTERSTLGDQSSRPLTQAVRSISSLAAPGRAPAS